MNPNDNIKVIRAAKEAAVKLTETEQTLRQRHEERVQVRYRTWSALSSRDQVIADASGLVDRTSSDWRELHGSGWVRRLAGYREIKVDAVGTWREREHEVAVRPQLPELHSVLQAPGALTLQDLCGLAPALVKESFTAMIHAVPDDRFGLAEPERAMKLAELDAEIAEIERQHTEIHDAAAEVGINLPLLKAVQDRRAEEQRKAERERERAAMRARESRPMAGVTVG